jgi:hypothetical protein
MYNSLDSSDPLSKYLKKYCLSLLSMSGTTGIPGTRKAEPPGYVSYSVKSRSKVGHPSTYKNTSGVYLFANKITGEQYIGSAYCLYTRFKSHMVNSTRPKG